MKIKTKKIFIIEKILKNYPCEFDHNGECLICDCWASDCAYNRYIQKDYRWESESELKRMFKK